jgi:hypothetical protein
MARWAYTFNLKYIGGLPVHLIYLEEAKKKAHNLGIKLAEEAILDADGRTEISQVDRLLGTHGNPWSNIEPAIDNLTNGTFRYEDSLVEYSLTHGKMTKESTISLMKKAGEELKLILQYYKIGNNEKVAEHLVKLRSYFSPATAEEFLNEEINRYAQNWDRKNYTQNNYSL